LLDKTTLEKTQLAADVENVGAGNRQETNAMAEKISKLKEDLARSEETTEVLRQILVEIRRLKMSPLRNLTGDSIDDLREERDRLIEENMKLKTGDYDDSGDKNTEQYNSTLVKYLRSKVRLFS
jgi:predicted RNase H-like nuclease (RuvC/YqgF family)